MIDVKTQLRHYGEQLDRHLTPVEPSQAAPRLSRRDDGHDRIDGMRGLEQMMQLIRRHTDRARPATLIAVIATLVGLVSIVSVIALRSPDEPPVAEGDGTWEQIPHDGTGPAPRGYV